MIVTSKFVGTVVPLKALGIDIVSKYVRIVHFISESIKQMSKNITLRMEKNYIEHILK